MRVGFQQIVRPLDMDLRTFPKSLSGTIRNAVSRRIAELRSKGEVAHKGVEVPQSAMKSPWGAKLGFGHLRRCFVHL